mmetsp:Transcript_25886/g.60105  ORF Transcript_25886/g.60105 Transcript_25886/m.60105 type:complete len:285 (-) Transcript_25886:26-880(-)
MHKLGRPAAERLLRTCPRGPDHADGLCTQAPREDDSHQRAHVGAENQHRVTGQDGRLGHPIAGGRRRWGEDGLLPRHVFVEGLAEAVGHAHILLVAPIHMPSKQLRAHLAQVGLPPFAVVAAFAKTPGSHRDLCANGKVGAVHAGSRAHNHPTKLLPGHNWLARGCHQSPVRKRHRNGLDTHRLHPNQQLHWPGRWHRALHQRRVPSRVHDEAQVAVRQPILHPFCQRLPPALPLIEPLTVHPTPALDFPRRCSNPDKGVQKVTQAKPSAAAEASEPRAVVAPL